MTNYTKEQIESGDLTPMELVDSWTSGQGNPTRPEYLENKKEVKTFISSNEVPETVLAARGILYLIKTGLSGSMREALLAGYAGGPNHFDQYRGKGKRVEKTEKEEAIPGHFMSDEQFLNNSILEFNSHQTMLDALIRICSDEKLTKADMVALAKEATAIPADRMAAIKELQNKHALLNSAKHDLSFYLDNIEIINEKTVRGVINPLLTEQELEDFDRLLSESFKSYRNEAIAAGKFSTKLQVTVVLKD